MCVSPRRYLPHRGEVAAFLHQTTTKTTSNVMPNQGNLRLFLKAGIDSSLIITIADIILSYLVRFAGIPYGKSTGLSEDCIDLYTTRSFTYAMASMSVAPFASPRLTTRE